MVNRVSLFLCVIETDVIVELVAASSLPLSLSVEYPLQPESAASKALVPNCNYYNPGGGASHNDTQGNKGGAGRVAIVRVSTGWTWTVQIHPPLQPLS
jgi:hypothetical protein